MAGSRSFRRRVRRHRFAARLRKTAAQEGTGRLCRFGTGPQAQRLPDLPRTLSEEGPTQPEDRPHNAFGKRLKAVRAKLKKAGKPSGIAGRVEAIADEDSDGDGVANLLELVTGHFPGEADDRPADGGAGHGGRAAIAALERSRSGYPWNPFERVELARGPRRALATAGSRNPIDAFIAAEHEARGLTPRPEASRPVLLRRLYLDLTGLPPTPDELHAFLADEVARRL